MPMVEACTGGSISGGSTHDSGGTLARYQFRPGVSDPAASRSAITWSVSGCPALLTAPTGLRAASQAGFLAALASMDDAPSMALRDVYAMDCVDP
jgi:hypothetical protein